MTVHHAVGICCQRNRSYRPSRVNIIAKGLSTADPSLSPTHLSIRRGRTTTTHYTHRQLSLMLSRNTTLGLRIGPAREAGLSAGMRRERVPLQIRKKERSSYEKGSRFFLTHRVHCLTDINNNRTNANSCCIAVLYTVNTLLSISYNVNLFP